MISKHIIEDNILKQSCVHSFLDTVKKVSLNFNQFSLASVFRLYTVNYLFEYSFFLFMHSVTWGRK